MSFKDLIPWRRSRQELPVQRMGNDQRPTWRESDDFGLAPLFRGTEELFERFFQGFGGPLFSLPGSFADGERAFGPPLQLDLSETDDAFHVSVELPGVDEKDIEVSISGGALSIRGEKRSENEQKKGDVYRMERSYGRFERTVALPAEVDEDEIQASFRRGVLEITLPKSPAARQRARKIQVRTDAT